MASAPRSNRREFLQGKPAADALAHVAGGDAPSAGVPEAAAAGYLVQFSRRAMACQFEFFFNAGQYTDDTFAATAALDLVDALEDQLSVYREHSEVSRLNCKAAQEPIQVEARLFALLSHAVRIYQATGGAYDVTSGPLSRAWGFTRRAGTIPSQDALAPARECVGSCYLELDARTRSVRFLRAGMEINLGSIGKGYALDRCAELLTELGADQFLLHGGHSSVLARGTGGGARCGWSVGVRNPLRLDRRLGCLRLEDRALATSGSGTQFFVHEGRRYGHILDPRTGWPAEGVLSVSVLAPTAAEADALSTAFYVMGPALAEQYCREHPEIGALLICPGSRTGSMDRHLFGIEGRDWTEVRESQ